MKVLALTMAAALFSTAASAQVLDATLGFGGVTPDLGCLSGAPEAGSRFPKTIYNKTTHERLMTNLSWCTGGYIDAWNEQTDRRWSVHIHPDGSASGKDEAGQRWTYDPKLKQFKLRDSGKTCGPSDVRRVCG
jgi:hypothetical protein